MRKFEKALRIASDMQQFNSPKDKLTDIINESYDDALSLEELEFVAAAASSPMKSFKEFEEMLKSRG